MEMNFSDWAPVDLLFFRYRSATYPRHCLKQFDEFRKEKWLCDVIINVGDKQFHAHRIVLASCSNYFKSMFSLDFKEKHEAQTTLHDVDPNALEEIINFAYSGEIVINDSNIHSLIVAASVVQIDELQKYCSDCLIDQISHSSCVNILKFSFNYSLTALYSSSLKFCLHHFNYIALDELLEAEPELLIEIISHDDLRSREEKIFELVINWINHDKEERLIHLPELMNCVRFAQMSSEYLCEVVSKNTIMKDCNKCRDFVEDAKDYLLHWQYKITDHPLSIARNFIKTAPRIYALGGWISRRALDSLEEYDPEGDCWTQLKPMNSGRCGVGAAIMDGILYCFGGHDGRKDLNCILRYDLVQRQWIDEELKMDKSRTSIAVAKVNNCIYVIGGQEGQRTLGQVDKYNPFTKKWSKCKPLITPRLGAGVGVIENKIYVVGGGTTQGEDSSFCTVEVYDTEADCWKEVKSMAIARKHAGCTAHNGIIYVVGGQGFSGDLNSAEMYDPVLDVWTKFPALKNLRRGLGLVCVNDTLYAIGGNEGEVYLRSVEAYNLKVGLRGQWQDKASMSNAPLAVGCVVYTGVE